MRLLTNVLLAGALIFGFILLEHHYRIADRLWQYRERGSAQPNVPKLMPPSSVTPPATPRESALPTDHDYQLVIDVSGKGPFMTVVHGQEPAAKKVTKKSKKTVSSQRAASKDQVAVQPQPQSPMLPQVAQPGTPAQPATPLLPQPTAPSGTKPQ